jgi:hypothetical protein
MNNFGESIPVAITSRALTHNFSNEEKDRRTAVLKNKDFYYDKADKYIDPVTPDVDVATVNLVRVITKKRTSLLYSQPLVREYDGPTESINFIEDLYQNVQIDKFLYSVDTMAELTGTGLIHIASADNEYGIKLMLYDGSEVSVLANPSDPNIADAISLIRMYDKLIEKNGSMQVERVLEQQIWTDSSVSVYSNNTTGAKPILERSESHDLPVMPFVPFKGEDVEGQYLGHSSATNWRSLNDTYNKLLTHLGFMVKMESATPIALEGYESGEGLLIHPGRAINMPVGARAEVLNFNPKIKDTLETVQYLEDKIFETSSVPKVTILGGEASSGRELMIQWFPLLQVYKDKAVRYKRYELNLTNTILTLVGLPPIDDMTIHFPESSVLPLSTEEDNLERDIKLNLKTAIDELMRRQPELTEAEAEAIIRANQQFNQDIIQSQEDTNGRSEQ